LRGNAAADGVEEGPGEGGSAEAELEAGLDALARQAAASGWAHPAITAITAAALATMAVSAMATFDTRLLRTRAW